MIPSSVPKKLAKLVDHWDDERSIGNSLIVMIKGGYMWDFDDHGTHVRGYDTVKEAVSELRAVVACNCEQCR